MSLSYRGSSRPPFSFGSSTSSSFRSGSSSTGSSYGRNSTLYGSTRSSLSSLRSGSGGGVSDYRRSTSFESSSGLGSNSYVPRSSYSGSSRSGSSYSSITSSIGRVSDDASRDRRHRRASDTSSSVKSSEEESVSSYRSRRTATNSTENTTTSETPTSESSYSRRRSHRVKDGETEGGTTRRRSRIYDDEDASQDDAFESSTNSEVSYSHTSTDLGGNTNLKERRSDIDQVSDTTRPEIDQHPRDKKSSLEGRRSSKTDASLPDSFDRKLATYVYDCESQSSEHIRKISQSSSTTTTNIPEPIHGYSSSNRRGSQQARDGGKTVEGQRQHISEDLPDNVEVEDDSRSKFGIFLTDRFNRLGISSSPTVYQESPTQQSSLISSTSSFPPVQGGRDTQALDTGDVTTDQLLDQVSKPRLPNGTAKTSNRTSATVTAGTSTKSKAAQEIERLECLCEARTKELTQTKIQLKASNQAFDAIGVLLNYCCTELNAFENPQLASSLATVQKQLTDCLAEISELTAQKENLTKDMCQVTKEKEEAVQKVEEAMTAAQSEKDEHVRVTKELDDVHNAALTTQRDELTTEHNNEVKKANRKHEQHLQLLQQSHERAISDLQNEGKMEMNGVRLAHLEEIQSLRNKHDSQMEELHKQHRNKLEDITLRFETIKVTLSEKVESLKGECEDHLRRARNSEEALQKDADVKVQMALAPYMALPKEIDSLKTVVEMRNEEIQKLRNRNTDLEKQLEEIPIAREKIISLQQKVENLEAIINIKTDHEKQLHEKCQVLMRKYDRETRTNKRLSMDYEQVMWRMSQSEYGSCESLTKRQLSRSPPRSETTSPDARRRIPVSSPNGEVKLRVKRRSESESDRNLRSRSATFVLEKNEDIDKLTRSPSSSPQNTPQRLKKRAEKEDGETREDFDKRMCQSAGAELITSSLNGSKYAWSIDMTGSQSSELNDEGLDCHIMESSGEMMNSFGRSLSGVSDSGMCDGLHSGNYDSMTGSELLNSSVFSTDSDWVTSANMSLNHDSINDFDPVTGQEIVNSNTVVDMTNIAKENPTEVSSSSYSESESCLSSSTSGNETLIEKDLNKICESEETDYEFQITLPGNAEEDVFDPQSTL